MDGLNTGALGGGETVELGYGGAGHRLLVLQSEGGNLLGGLEGVHHIGEVAVGL